MFILLTVAIAPGLALFSYFYLRKEIAKEPSRTLFHTFIYGAIMTFPIMFIQHVFEEENVFSSFFIRDVVFTSGLEEFFKWLILLLAIYRHVEFEDAYDGILYGASVSLGFATVENILYLFTFGTILHLFVHYFRYRVMRCLVLSWGIILVEQNLLWNQIKESIYFWHFLHRLVFILFIMAFFLFMICFSI